MSCYGNQASQYVVNLPPGIVDSNGNNTLDCCECPCGSACAPVVLANLWSNPNGGSVSFASAFSASYSDLLANCPNMAWILQGYDYGGGYPPGGYAYGTFSNGNMVVAGTNDSSASFNAGSSSLSSDYDYGDAVSIVAYDASTNENCSPRTPPNPPSICGFYREPGNSYDYPAFLCGTPNPGCADPVNVDLYGTCCACTTTTTTTTTTPPPLGCTTAYVGFGGSTGAEREKHEILSFYFTNQFQTITSINESDVTFIGDAYYSAGSFVLTDDINQQAGNFYLNTPVQFKTQNGNVVPFNVRFTMRMTPSVTRADGITFIIQSESSSAGGTGGGIGYLGITQSIGVAFDTFNNGSMDNNQNNNIEFDINGNVTSSISQVNLNSNVMDLADGQIKYVWIDYSGGDNLGILSVYISNSSSKPASPSLMIQSQSLESPFPCLTTTTTTTPL